MTKVKYRLYKGLHLDRQGREYIIDRLLANGELQLQDVATKNLVVTTEGALIDEWASDNMKFLGDGETNLVKQKYAKSFVEDLTALDQNDPRRKEFRRRFAYIKEIITSDLTLLTRTTVEPLIKKVHKKIKDRKRVPNWQTVCYFWYRAYIRSGEDVRSLIPNYKERGNRSRKFTGKKKKKGDKYNEREREKAEAIANIVDEVIDEEYLNSNRLTVDSVHETIVARVDEENNIRSPAEKLSAPSKSSVYAIVSKLDKYEVVKARYGEEVANRLFKAYQKGPQPKRPLQRVEIDHTKLDLFVFDWESMMPVGRPTLTTLIDKATRMILGFYVSFNGPGYLSVMRCFLHAIVPKTYVKEKYPGIVNEWMPYGIPEYMAVDNGLEFHSEDLEDACLQIGTIVQFCPVRHPWYKAVIERYFKTQNTKLLHELPGTTFSNIIDKGDYDPEKNAVISFDTLIEVIHKFIIDYYCQRKHRGLKDIPARVWEILIQKFPPALPPNRDRLKKLLGQVEYRTIQPYGINLFGLQYNDPALVTLRCETKDKLFKIKFDPEGLSVIDVADPKTGNLIPVPSTEPAYTKGLTLYQHTIIKRYLRKMMEEYTNVVDLCRAKEEIKRIIERDWRKLTKSVPRSRMARYKNISQPNYVSAVDVKGAQHSEIPVDWPARLPLLNPASSNSVGISDMGSAISIIETPAEVANNTDAGAPLLLLDESPQAKHSSKREDDMIARKPKASKEDIRHKDPQEETDFGFQSAIPEDYQASDLQVEDDDGLDITGWEIDTLAKQEGCNVG